MHNEYCMWRSYDVGGDTESTSIIVSLSLGVCLVQEMTRSWIALHVALTWQQALEVLVGRLRQLFCNHLRHHSCIYTSTPVVCIEEVMTVTSEVTNISGGEYMKDPFPIVMERWPRYLEPMKNIGRADLLYNKGEPTTKLTHCRINCLVNRCSAMTGQHPCSGMHPPQYYWDCVQAHLCTKYMQWHIRTEDTLGPQSLSSFRRLSIFRRFSNTCLVYPL